MDLEAYKQSFCRSCGKVLTRDEIGIYRKLIRRDASDCLCLGCFACSYGVAEEELQEKIQFFREAGCLLF